MSRQANCALLDTLFWPSAEFRQYWHAQEWRNALYELKPYGVETRLEHWAERLTNNDIDYNRKARSIRLYTYLQSIFQSRDQQHAQQKKHEEEEHLIRTIKIIKKIRDFYSTHGQNTSNITLSFDVPHGSYKPYEPGTCISLSGVLATASNNVIWLSPPVVEVLEDNIFHSLDIHPYIKHLLCHEYIHITSQDSKLRQCLYDLFRLEYYYEDLKHNMTRKQEFRADYEGFNLLSNAELYQYLTWSKASKHEKNNNPSPHHLSIKQNETMVDEILKRRATGIEEPSAVAHEFFRNNRKIYDPVGMLLG